MGPVVEGADLTLAPLELAVRSLYSSVVTMTTLGFGDMHANPASIAGHALLMVQVLLGYMMLGSLITRLAIFFQSRSR